MSSKELSGCLAHRKLGREDNILHLENGVRENPTINTNPHGEGVGATPLTQGCPPFPIRKSHPITSSSQAPPTKYKSLLLRVALDIQRHNVQEVPRCTALGVPPSPPGLQGGGWAHGGVPAVTWQKMMAWPMVMPP